MRINGIEADTEAVGYEVIAQQPNLLRGGWTVVAALVVSASLLLFVAYTLLFAVAVVQPRLLRQQQVRSELPHAKMAIAGRQLLRTLQDPLTLRVIDDIPEAIAATRPAYIYVAANVLFVEYGGGFGHFGIAIYSEAGPAIPIRQVTDKHEKLAEGLYYYESE